MSQLSTGAAQGTSLADEPLLSCPVPSDEYLFAFCILGRELVFSWNHFLRHQRGVEGRFIDKHL
jgi:hypothetical protein